MPMNGGKFNLTSEAVAIKLVPLFRSLGRYPETIQSDNGPQFVSEVLRCKYFTKYCKSKFYKGNVS